MEAKFDIKGLKELNRELKALPEDFRTKALNGSTLEAAKVIKDEAVSLVPVDTGNLRGSIRAQRKKSPSKYLSKYQVNVKPKGKVTILRSNRRSTNSTFYARFVEEGTTKMAARPFMRPAFDRKKEDAVRAFRTRLNKKIAFYQRKLSRLR